MLLILSSIFPVVVIMVYLYYRDKYEKEPIRVLMKAFGGGVLTIIPALFLAVVFQPGAQLFSNNAFLLSFYNAFLLAAVPEEVSKFLFLYLLIWHDKNFNEYFDGIIYAVFVSMGFALIENILYVIEGGYGVAIGRAILSVPAHALFGVIMGYYFAHAKFIPSQKAKYLFKGVLFAILAHGIYNFLLMYSNALIEINPIFALMLLVIFLGFIIKLHKIGFAKIKKHVEASVFK